MTQWQTTPDAIAQWTDDPRVAALLANIQRNPPQLRHFKVPSNSSTFGRDDAWEYVGADIDALNRISNEYFLTAEIAGGRDGALAFMATQPSVESVVQIALAERALELAA